MYIAHKSMHKLYKAKLKKELLASLRDLLQETDINKFKASFEMLIHNFANDKDLGEFGKYFMNYYAGCTQYRAYCYRRNTGINTNMPIERFYRTFKYYYLNAKK